MAYLYVQQQKKLGFQLKYESSHIENYYSYEKRIKMPLKLLWYVIQMLQCFVKPE